MPRPTSTETLPFPVWRLLRRLLGGTAWGLLYSWRERLRRRKLVRALRSVTIDAGGHRGISGPAVPAAGEMTEAVERAWRTFGVDKLTHGYSGVYGGILGDLLRRTGNPSVLEIGIFEGASLRAWRDLLPTSELVGYDIDATALFEESGIRTYAVDQMDVAGLTSAARRDGPFDLIVDDGWHQPQANVISLAVLAPFLREGGYYVVEDIDARRYRGLWRRLLGEMPSGFSLEYLRCGTSGLAAHDVLVLHRRASRTGSLSG